MTRKATPPADLLSDPDVRRWYENLSRGSRATADVNARRLAAFCDALQLDPKALARLHEKELHDRFLDFVVSEEKRGVAGSYIVRTLKGAKSWLLHNGVKLSRPVKVRGAKESPKLADERVPTPQELRQILLAGTPRIRTACSLVAFSGLRPEVLGNYLGDDGLVLGDLPELKVDKNSVEFSTSPTLVRVRPGLSKNSTGYLTFLSTEGCEYLKQYLEERLRSGEKLGPDSDLIHPDRAGKRFIRTINIGDAIRTAIRGAGFAWRPYVLRHYFDTQLLMAESKGKVAHDFRVYWMGHAGSIDARYTTNKRQVPKEFLEEMRAAYERCEPFLSTQGSATVPADQIQREAAVFLLMGMKGRSEADARRLVEGKSGEELANFFKPNERNEKAVPADEAQGFLDAGWTFVGALKNGEMAVVRSPEGLASGHDSDVRLLSPADSGST